jgi:hypothetical protein
MYVQFIHYAYSVWFWPCNWLYDKGTGFLNSTALRPVSVKRLTLTMPVSVKRLTLTMSVSVKRLTLTMSVSDNCLSISDNSVLVSDNCPSRQSLWSTHVFLDNCLLKGQWHEIFWPRFFSWIYSIWASYFEAKWVFFSFSFSRSYSNVSIIK